MSINTIEVRIHLNYKYNLRLTGKFSQMFSKTPNAERKHVFLCKFREILPSGSRWNRALFNGRKKFGSRSRCRFCADRAQNLSGTAPSNILGVPQISSKSVHFRVNIVQTHQKVFAILGEASAYSWRKRLRQWLNNHTASLEITVNVHESVLSRKLVFCVLDG